MGEEISSDKIVEYTDKWKTVSSEYFNDVEKLVTERINILSSESNKLSNNVSVFISFAAVGMSILGSLFTACSQSNFFIIFIILEFILFLTSAYILYDSIIRNKKINKQINNLYLVYATLLLYKAEEEEKK
ncbi:MAG: hypothetical protein IJ583_13560 [Firmicutes bacterium]|nr:hypothetical protein [Bacillota bacterium]